MLFVNHSKQAILLPRWIEILAVVAFWVLLGAIALVRRALLPIPFSVHTIAVTVVEYLPWLLMTPVAFWLARRLPLNQETWKRNLVVHFVLAGVVTITLVSLHRTAIPALGPPAGVGERSVSSQNEPDTNPGSAPPHRRDASPPLAVPSLHFAFYLFALGVGFARAYAIQAKERQRASERLEAIAAQQEIEQMKLASNLSVAKLEAFRMQLNPHFLFNALNAVSALAESDPVAVRHIIARLSGLLRRMLDADAFEEVPLKDELDFLHDYIALQQVRFNDGFVVEENITHDAEDALLPSLILQPLIENAIEHGISKRKPGSGRVIIQARRHQGGQGHDELVISITDNGPGIAEEALMNDGIGIRNTKARLEGHYGSAASLQIRRAEEGGTVSEITLPYRQVRTLSSNSEKE